MYFGSYYHFFSLFGTASVRKIVNSEDFYLEYSKFPVLDQSETSSSEWLDYGYGPNDGNIS